MQTIESLKRNIQSAQDLLGVVKTMKALAAVSIRQYQKAVESLSEYNRTVEMGLQVVLKRSRGSFAPMRSSSAKRMGAIVFGTDQGLCGQFNNIVTAHAIAEMNALGIAKENRVVISVGLRAADILEDSGQKVLEILSTPGSTAGITPMVQDITSVLEDWRFKRQIENMYLYYNEYISGANYRPKTLKLLPVDKEWLKSLEKRKWESRTIPMFTEDWETTVPVPHPGISVRLALPGLRRFTGQRECQSACGHAERREEHRGAARGTLRPVSPPAPEHDHGRASRHRVRVRGHGRGETGRSKRLKKKYGRKAYGIRLKAKKRML